MSALEDAVRRLWIAHEGDPAEFARVMRRAADRAERAARMTQQSREPVAEPFLQALRDLDGVSL